MSNATATPSRRLVRMLPDACARPGGGALAGGVGLLLLTLASALGLDTGAQVEPARNARGGDPPIAVVAKLSAADVHRQEVFEARRENFSRNTSERALAKR